MDQRELLAAELTEIIDKIRQKEDAPVGPRVEPAPVAVLWSANASNRAGRYLAKLAR
jgi:hypothetical protein